MTEQEALEKRCCGPEGCGIKREVKKSEPPFNDTYVRFCIGSACMSWRDTTVTFMGESSAPTGFCGLAGKP